MIGREPFLLEEHKPFGQSLLWRLQRQYYMEKGIRAWRNSEVPHYITTNRMIARSYAEIVFAFLRDHCAVSSAELPTDEPFYICELGGGSGRFACYFLDALTELYEQSDPAPPSFCYILTDIADDNIAFWRDHPRLQPYIAQGLLDFALFDAESSDSFALQLNNRQLTPGSLSRPLVVFANYVFDSVPQQLFYFKNGRVHDCPVSIHINDPPELLSLAEQFTSLRVQYDFLKPPKTDYDQPELQALLDDYARILDDEAYLLFPEAILQCILRLRSLSCNGLLLLSSDYGEHALPYVQQKSPPPLAYHHSFSLAFNYHALCAFNELLGGVTLSPRERHSVLCTHAFLLVPQVSRYVETRHAYERHVAKCSPEDMFYVALHMNNTVQHMSLNGILAWLRLSRYDSDSFAHCFPRLLELVSAWSSDERSEVIEALHRVWNAYYPLGEERDIANLIAQLCYEMDDYLNAYAYFQQSSIINGRDTGTLYNMAACLRQLGQPKQARPLLELALAHDPDNEATRLMLDDVSRAAAL